MKIKNIKLKFIMNISWFIKERNEILKTEWFDICLNIITSNTVIYTQLSMCQIYMKLCTLI